MKTNLTEKKSTYFSLRRIRGRHILQNLRLALSRLKRTKVQAKNIMQWEDDGGQINGVNETSKISDAAHFDTFGNEIVEPQPEKKKKIVNDSLGG